MTHPLPLGRSKLVAILGHPIGHVIAPRLYSPAFWNAGLDWHLIPLGVAPRDLHDTIRALEACENVIGLNITMPHKKSAFALCSRLGAAARFEGVVNTIRFEDGVLTGDSFDGAGFVAAAKAAGLLDPGRRAVVIGAGGAGRAITRALAAEGCRRISIHNRSPDPARHLARLVAAQFAQTEADCAPGFEGAGLVVNATSLGLHAGDPMPADPAALPEDCAVFDIIAARDTEFLMAARARGLAAIGGVPMIEHQIAAQTAFWQGTDPQ